MARSRSLGTYVGLVAVLFAAGCGGDDRSPSPTIPAPALDCATLDTSSLSQFAVDAFRRDLAIDTPNKLREHLDSHPELICRTLHSERYGDLTPIGYASGHRPDAHGIFPLLIERGARAEDALPVAVMRGDARVVPWLLDHGVDPDTRSAIVIAARQDDTSMVRRLLEAGADPGRPSVATNWTDDDGRTALHWAAVHKRKTMLEALLDAGAHVDAVVASGRSALAEAVSRDDASAVRLLYDRGAAPTRLDPQTLQRLLRLARRYRMQDIVDFIE
ncbi:MAG: ankyrin repeat domain-containing protein [bacterium]|nr:ankyrin repeat domain-containing protein [bacterium]